MISGFKDRMLLGKVTTQELKTSGAPETLSMTVTDKIALISGYKRGEDQFVMVSQDQRSDSFKSMQNISAIVPEILNDLIQAGILPPVDFNQGIQLNKCTLKTYANMDQPNQTVTVWDIDLTSGGYTISLTIDMDTHLVYQFFIWSEEPLPSMDIKAVSEKLSDYLGLVWDKEFKYDESGVQRLSAENRRFGYEFFYTAGGNGYFVQIASGSTVVK
jgi:hypothetical protein